MKAMHNTRLLISAVRKSVALLGLAILPGTFHADRAGAAPADEDTTAKVAAASLSAEKVALFRLKEAPVLPDLSVGGFAREPAFGDDFAPGWNARNSGWRIAAWRQNGTEMSPARCTADPGGHLVQTVLAGEPNRGGLFNRCESLATGVGWRVFARLLCLAC